MKKAWLVRGRAGPAASDRGAAVGSLTGAAPGDTTRSAAGPQRRENGSGDTGKAEARGSKVSRSIGEPLAIPAASCRWRSEQRRAAASLRCSIPSQTPRPASCGDTRCRMPLVTLRSQSSLQRFGGSTTTGVDWHLRFITCTATGRINGRSRLRVTATTAASRLERGELATGWPAGATPAAGLTRTAARAPVPRARHRVSDGGNALHRARGTCVTCNETRAVTTVRSNPQGEPRRA